MMRRRDFLQTAGGAAASLVLAGLASCSKNTGLKRMPNFVIIFTDDQGYGDVGCYGAQGYKTPNLDRMAVEGMRFTDFYAAPACSPSRAALLTGSYPLRAGIPNVLGPSARTGKPVGLNPDEVTIAKILKTKGYATGVFGKWHLGDHPEFLPRNHGFDYYYGLPYSNDMTKNKYGDPPLPLIRNEEVIEAPADQNTLTKRYTEEAVQFIEQNKENPFFVYIPHTMVHIPLYASDQFRNTTEQGLYGDVMEEIDWSVGQILDVLKRNDLDENTLVIFTSDNGPWLCYGDHAGSSGPLREGKGTTFEGGIRVPCLMRWPGQIPAGSVCSELVCTMDFLPTIAKLAGADIPTDRVIDGKDVFPLLAGEPDAVTPHDRFYYYRGGHLRAVRSGKWKLHIPHPYRSLTGEPGMGGQSAGYTEETIGLALFDLQNDIGERVNLASYYPDVVQRLQGYIEEAREDIGDLATKTVGKNARPMGRL